MSDKEKNTNSPEKVSFWARVNGTINNRAFVYVAGAAVFALGTVAGRTIFAPEHHCDSAIEGATLEVE